MDKHYNSAGIPRCAKLDEWWLNIAGRLGRSKSPSWQLRTVAGTNFTPCECFRTMRYTRILRARMRS